MKLESELQSLCRRLPQLGELLERDDFVALIAACPRPLVADTLRSALENLRHQIKQGTHTDESVDHRVAQLCRNVELQLRSHLRPSLRKVLNATGVILQTNLGRAPLSDAALQRIAEVAGGYCNLEMDLETGDRGRRDVHVEALILRVLASRIGTPIETFSELRGAAVVNNCAAATLLALNTLAEGGEVIVSRGELVEIGGGFRIPEILRKSGAILREVGTTNRTRIADYADAVTPQTRLILRVHRSNFRIEGFTSQPTLAELIELGSEVSVPVFEDQGTGCLIPLDEHGIRDESHWAEDAGSGVALIACSGDKLLGGSQCGILAGEHDVIERIRANPLFRALRVDKLAYAALETTLLQYLSEHEAEIPAIAMLRLPADVVKQRCETLAEQLRSPDLSVDVVAVESVIGGGTTPSASLPSFAVALQHARMSEGALAALLRSGDPPVVGRATNGRVLFDLRTISAREDHLLFQSVQSSLERIGAPSSTHPRSVAE